MIDAVFMEIYKECLAFARQFITMPDNLHCEIHDYVSGMFEHENIPCFTSSDGVTIIFNRDWLKRSLPEHVDDVSFFVFHELRHVYQRQQIAAWLLGQRTEENKDIVSKWEKEFKEYQTNYGDEESQNRNLAQEVEIDANAYALSLLNLKHLIQNGWLFEHSLPQAAFDTANERSKDYNKSRPELKRYYDRKYRELSGKNASGKKPGRNDICPCGSGKKFKKCCNGKGIYD